MIPVKDLRHVAFTLDPVKLLKEAQKETRELTYLAKNHMFLNQEITIFQNLESSLSNLKNDLETASKNFETLAMNERREEGNCLIWKICKIRTLIQQELRTVSDDREQLYFKNFSNWLRRIEIEHIHPLIDC
jgi:hypothetical protein